jgi:ATP-binding cassette subfamily B protein
MSNSSFVLETDAFAQFQQRYAIIESLPWQRITAILGEVIYPHPEPDSRPGLWLLCQGKVRLLQMDAAQNRSHSITLLMSGEVFGFELLLPQIEATDQVNYQAVAADACELMYLPIVDWQSLIQTEAASALINDLRQIAQRRSIYAFFRQYLSPPATLGRLPSLSPQQLQQLVNKTQRITLAPGEDLSTLLGRCWLRSGELSGNTGTIPIGTAWGVIDAAPIAKAQTELQLYQISPEDWGDLVTHIPLLANATATAKDNSISPSQLTIAQRTDHDKTTSTKTRQPRTTSAPHRIATPQRRYRIHFPQPRWGRHLRFAFPFIAQQSSSDCGITCLAMIGRHWGAPSYPLPQLREWAKVGRSGSSLKNLASTAEKLGYVARPVRASLNALMTQKRPWIAHWQGDHYIVVYGEQPQTVLIADPAVGRQRIPKREFMQHWSGYALTLEPTEQIYQQEFATGQKLSQFGRLLLSYRGVLTQIIGISLLIQVFGLIGPVLTQIIFDRVVSQKSLSMLHLFSIGLLIFGGWRLAMTSIRQYLLDYFGNRLELTLISAFIRHTLSLPLSFFEARNVGDIITRIQENSKIQQFLMRQAVSTWLDALMGIAYLGLMFYYNASLTWVVIGLIPPLVILTLVATPFLKSVSREAFKESAEQTSLVVEMMSGIAAVKTAAIEQEIRWRWEDRLARTLNIQFKGQKLGNLLQVLSGLINTIGSTALLWYGANLVIHDQITIGQLVAFNMLIGNVLGPAISVIGVWDELQEVLISVERLNDVFATAPEEAIGANHLILPPLKGEICCNKVTFAYDGAEDRPILQNIDFVANPGETIALVGRSGSGKTTLIKLLQGFYYPTEGNILVDGHDVQHISLPSLRSQLGVVPQDCFLFSGTILENIRLYRPDYSLESVVEVAKMAEAHHFIQSLPMGYNTKVGERGANLSGGQRQRIAIARALLGNPGLLILDEATSALDTESERRFQRNLERISRDRTTFIIAHRLSTVQNADRILVLDRGLLVEQGNHLELMAKKGLYYHLAQQQLNL